MAFYILFSYIVSCKDNVRKMIDNGDFKYWKDDSDRATYYYFDSAGRWTIYERYDIVRKDESMDHLLHGSWYLVNDRTININGYARPLVKVTPNKLVWLRTYDTASFTAASKEEIPPKYQKRQRFVRIIKVY